MPPRLTPVQQQIYDLVRRGPKTATELMGFIYWMHPAEAPHRSTIKANVWHMNQRLRARGECIRAERGRHRETPYELHRAP